MSARCSGATFSIPSPSLRLPRPWEIRAAATLCLLTYADIHAVNPSTDRGKRRCCGNSTSPLPITSADSGYRSLARTGRRSLLNRCARLRRRQHGEDRTFLEGFPRAIWRCTPRRRLPRISLCTKNLPRSGQTEYMCTGTHFPLPADPTSSCRNYFPLLARWGMNIIKPTRLPTPGNRPDTFHFSICTDARAESDLIERFLRV